MPPDANLVQALTPPEERIALLEATVAGLQAEIADLQYRLSPEFISEMTTVINTLDAELRRLAPALLTVEGPARNMVCEFFGNYADLGLSVLDDTVFVPMWQGCEPRQSEPEPVLIAPQPGLTPLPPALTPP
jgi:hypothetical protein